MRFRVAFLVVAVLAAVPVGQSQAQQKTDTSEKNQGNTIPKKTAQEKEISNLNARIEELGKSLQNLQTISAGLQTKLAELEQKEAAITVVKRSTTDQLNKLKSELARFDCKSDQDQAFAAAIADRMPVHTYEGAGAMQCTTRLKNIVEKVVQVLNQE